MFIINRQMFQNNVHRQSKGRSWLFRGGWRGSPAGGWGRGRPSPWWTPRSGTRSRRSGREAQVEDPYHNYVLFAPPTLFSPHDTTWSASTIKLVAFWNVLFLSASLVPYVPFSASSPSSPSAPPAFSSPPAPSAHTAPSANPAPPPLPSPAPLVSLLLLLSSCVRCFCSDCCMRLVCNQ